MPDPRSKAFDFSGSATEFQRHYLEPFWQRRLVELSALCRLVELECPRLASACGLGTAYRALRAAGPRAIPVLRSPALLLWINVSRYFVMRDVHRALPAGHVHDHFHDLHRFAFAAAAANSGVGEASVRMQRDGTISLPGLGLTLSLDTRSAGKMVTLVTQGDDVTAVLDGERHSIGLTSDPGAGDRGRRGWSANPRFGWGIEIDDSIELSRPHCANNPDWKVRQIDQADIARWRNGGERACELIERIDGDLWVPVREVLSAIVPLESPPQVNLSGTCAEVLGCICTSLPDNAALLGETLVHEAAHTALHIVTDEQTYWVPTAGRLYRSPWRKDLRPMSGMMHGIVAFLAVSEFWARLFERAAATDFDQLGRFRLRTVARQVQEALAEIRGSDELTAAGNDLCTSSERRIEALYETSRRFAPTADVESSVEQRLSQHHAALAQLPRDIPSPENRRSDPQWSRMLDTTMPPPVNRPEFRLVGSDVVSDRIHMAAFKQDPVLKDWEALLKKTTRSEPESAALVRGSISYGRGDYPQAVASYAAYVERRWDDLDAWRLLGAALRRSERSQDALAIAFGMAELQRQSAAEFRKRFGSEWPFYLHQLTATGPEQRHAS